MSTIENGIPELDGAIGGLDSTEAGAFAALAANWLICAMTFWSAAMSITCSKLDVTTDGTATEAVAESPV